MGFAYQPRTDPHDQFDHQKSNLEEVWDLPAHAWWWEQGTAKSRQFTDNAGALYCEKMIDGALLVAPNGLHRNFITKEVPKWLPDDVAERSRTLFWHTDKSKTKRWQNEARDFIAHKDGIRVLGLSYDGLMTEIGRKLAKEFLTSGRMLYGLDESPRIKEPSAKRTIRVLSSAEYAPFRRILTGTPVANAPWDVYTQVKFLDSNFWHGHGLDSPEAMKTAFGEWEKGNRRVPLGQARWPSGKPKIARMGVGGLKYGYRVDGDTAFQEFPRLKRDDDGRPRYRNLAMLRDILRPIRSRILKTDVFDLPLKMYTPLEFDLAPAQRRAYEQMRDLGFAVAGDRSCSAPMALTVLLRLQQIACGYLVTDLQHGEEDPVVLPITPNPRLDLLVELAQGISHQCLVWARFRPDIDLIMESLAKLGLTAVRYDGAVDDDQRAENEERFHRGDAQFFVSNPAVGGEGLTLNEAKTSIYYSNSFKLLERLQSEDRNHRWGQDGLIFVPGEDASIQYIDLIARDTVDEGLVLSLLNKYDVASMVQGDQLRRWLSAPDRLF